MLEYRNNEAKEYLKLYSEEKALEATIQVITDAINKSVIPAKDGIQSIKQLAINFFMTARLKEKAEQLAKSNS